MADAIRRGLAAGLVAGLLAGLFALLVGEVPVRAAIALEEAAAGAEVGEPPLVDRTAQQALLPVATAIVGTAFGGMFGLALLALRRHLVADRPWRTTLRVGAATWAAVSLFPALLYPPNPPAVGDGSTIGARSAWFVGAVVIGLVIAIGATWLATTLRRRGVAEPLRHLAVAGVVVVAAGVAWAVLPPAADPGEAVPAGLLWDFRLASLATQLLLWGGITCVFGLLADRAERPAGDRAPA